ELDLFSRKPHLVTAAIVATAVDAELVLLHLPLAGTLAAHGVACERAIGRKDVGPMRFVGNFHSGKLGPNLRTVELLEFLRTFNGQSDGEDADNRGYCRDGVPPHRPTFQLMP